MNMRSQLINDIKMLNPEMLTQAHYYMELLKTNNNPQVNTWKQFVGCISAKEADEQKNLINKEFENIEGEW